MVNDIAVQDFVNAIKEQPTDTNTTYNATVSRVDNEGVVWVNLYGSDKETPTASTSTEVKRGDTVTVNWRNNKLYIGGNYTNPSAGVDTVKPSVEYVSELINKDITVNSINAASGYIGELESKNIKAEDISADHAMIQELDVESMSAATAYIRDLTSENITAEDIAADHATVSTLDSTYATINELHSDYAEIDLANVNNAWIENGAMKKAEVFDENVFDLSGDHATISRIDASKINVANLNADNLIVRRINGQPVVGGYTLISPSSSGYASKNPRALGWYEFVNAQFVLSTDTTVDMTKAYYQTGNEVSLYDQTYIDGMKNSLQQQIDGAVETFTGSVVPTLTNYPYNEWYNTSVTPVHDERAKHVGDIYYVINSSLDEDGYCYRFAYDNTTHAYSWVLIKDSDVTKALSDISDLQTFESNTTSWMEETDEGLVTIRQNYTTLSGTVDKTVKESIQLWFTKANTTAPNKPNSTTYPNGVTDTSTAGNGWRVVVPAWNVSYPNYFYCWQYKFVDGTFGWSNVVRDIAMGETQGMSRDAKNTADNALPASTFETFESTTFAEIVDEVDEQSTTMTNMTTRLGLNTDGTGANTDIVAKESALEQTVDGISTRVGKTETKLIGMYATSSTAAGTAAKVATITPTLPSGATWELGTGTIITVKFTNANTTSSPTLNVNSKGAKAIKTYANGNLSEAEYKWAAGSTFTFVYNGTNWLMQDSSVSVRMNSNETSISQTADSIISLASGNTTYTKPDGTTATSAIGTTVNQTANNVLIKATRTGATTAEQQAGGTSAAALINVAPDTVKIAANHVEITGTAVFDAVNNDDSASAAMLNSNIEIGGRNILAGTVAAVSKATTSTSGYVTQSLYYTPNRKTLSDLGYVVNDEVTLSFDWKITNATTYGNARIEWCGYKDSSNQDVYLAPLINPFATFSSSNTYGHVNTTVKLTATTVNAKRLLVRIDNSNLTLTISNLKLEKGNKATTWTPAPEDALSKSVPIYGRTNSSTAPTASALPTVIITNTDDTGTTAPSSNGNGWTKMHMSRICSSNANYKYLWTCNQLISAGGYLLGHTDIVADNGTTVINGDEITTGTISADRLNIAGTITAINNNTTTTINGGKIATNSISANRLRIGDYTNYITANENDAESIKVAGNLSIVDGWLYKNNTESNAWLSAARSRWANIGDKYRITGTVKMANTGRVQILIYSRNTDESSINSNGTGWIAYNTANSELNINSIITIAHSSFANCAKCNVAIVLRDSSDNNSVGYCKNMQCERISDAQVGGTNILRRTENITISGTFWPDYGWYKNGTGTVTTGVSISDSPIPTITKAVQLTATTANTDIGFAQGGVPLHKGLVTQSVWAKGTAGDKIILQPVWASGDSAVTETGRMSFTIADGEWHRYTYTKEVLYDHPAMSAHPSDSNLAANAGYVYLNTPTVGHTLLVVGDKLEYGEKATEWTSGEDDYITSIDEAGIRIHPSNTLNNSAVINANGMEIFKGGTTSAYSVAKYGDTARVGKLSGGNVYVDAETVNIKDGSTVLSTFTSSGAELGKNSDTASIKMCADKFTIKGSYSSTISSNDTFVATINNEHTGLWKILQLKSGGLLGLTDFNGNKTAQLSAEGAQVITEYDETDGNSILIFVIDEDTSEETRLLISPNTFTFDGGNIKNLYGYNDTVTYKPNLYIGTTGIIRRTTYVVDNTSSKRFKHDIKDITNPALDPHLLYDIEVKQFRFNEDTEASRKGIDLIGFIAEQVEEVYPIAVDYDENGQVETWREHYIIPPMLKLIQEQHEQIDGLTKRIEALERNNK